MSVVFDILLLVVVSGSVLSNLYGAPGNILIAFSSLFYGITTGFDNITFTFVAILFGIVLLLEFIEFLLISLTAKKYGSSKWGIIGAIIGGIVGAISGAFVTPVVGAIVGSFTGVFLGAFLLELIAQSSLKAGLLSGFGAFLGKIGGLSVKVIGSVTMAIMIFDKII